MGGQTRRTCVHLYKPSALSCVVTRPRRSKFVATSCVCDAACARFTCSAASHAVTYEEGGTTWRSVSQFTCTHHRATRQTNTACVHVHQWQRSHKSRTAKGARAGLGLLVAPCTLGGTSWQHAELRRPCKGEQAHSRGGRSLFSRGLRRSRGRRCQVPGIHRQTLGCRRERAAHHLHLHARGGGGLRW